MKKKLLFIIFIVFTLSDTLIAQDWQIGGSALTTTGKLGSTTKQNVQLITNNAARLTLTSAGIFKINSDQSSIQFSNAGANPKPMMFIYESGVNTSRMVLAHSPGFPDYGLRYNSNDQFDFIGSGQTVLNVGLGSKSVGIGTSQPLSRLHIKNGISGASPIANTILAAENSTSGYISVLVPVNAESGILFGKPLDAASGGIIYNNPGNVNGLQFRTNGNATRMVLTNTGDLGLGTAAPKSSLHIFRGSAGGISPNVESPIVAESNGNSFINLLTPVANVSGILFGNNTNVADGGIVYGGASRRMEFRAKANKTGMVLTTDGSFDQQPRVGINTINPNVELEIVHSELDGVSNHGLTIHHVSATGNFRWNFYTTRFGDLELYTDINSIAPKGHFIAATGEYASLSDARMKKDVENAPEVLSKVLQLDIKKYHFLDNKPEEKKHYGMIAQEVEKIFPEIVYHNLADGSKRDYYTMNYSALGVLAIKAIQEMAKRNDEKNNTTDALQKQIDALKKQNEEQQKQIDELKAVVLKNSQQQGITQHPSADPLSKSIVAFVPSLEQNAPNPFNNSTTIHYILPQKFTNAQIVITDNAGKAVKQINISGAGKGRINVDAATLSSGAYTYSLIVEEKIIGTKKMILAK